MRARRSAHRPPRTRSRQAPRPSRDWPRTPGLRSTASRTAGTIPHRCGSRSPRRATQQAFIGAVAPGALAAQHRYGVPAAVTIAQAIDESGWGQSQLAARDHNLFGIKGTGPAGSVPMPTQEYVNGQSVSTSASFRVYHDAAESIEDHGRLLARSGYYQQAMADRHNPGQVRGRADRRVRHRPQLRGEPDQPHAPLRPVPYGVPAQTRPAQRPAEAEPGSATIPGVPGAAPVPAEPWIREQAYGQPAADPTGTPQPVPDRSPQPTRRGPRSRPRRRPRSRPRRGPRSRRGAPARSRRGPRSRPRGRPRSRRERLARRPGPLTPGRARRAARSPRPARSRRARGSPHPAPADSPRATPAGTPSPVRLGTRGRSVCHPSAQADIPGVTIQSESDSAHDVRGPLRAGGTLRARRPLLAGPRPGRPGGALRTGRPPGRDAPVRTSASPRDAGQHAPLPAADAPVRAQLVRGNGQGPAAERGDPYRDVASFRGISWQLLAACDWMQCEARPRRSPVYGERLGTVNTDGTVYTSNGPRPWPAVRTTWSIWPAPCTGST